MPSKNPDLNPKEMLWYGLKHFLQTIVKTTTKEQLKKGITRFWRDRVMAEKCTTNVNHLKKGVPMVIQKEVPQSTENKTFFFWRTTMAP